MHIQEKEKEAINLNSNFELHCESFRFVHRPPLSFRHTKLHHLGLWLKIFCSRQLRGWPLELIWDQVLKIGMDIQVEGTLLYWRSTVLCGYTVWLVFETILVKASLEFKDKIEVDCCWTTIKISLYWSLYLHTLIICWSN